MVGEDCSVGATEAQMLLWLDPSPGTVSGSCTGLLGGNGNAVAAAVISCARALLASRFCILMTTGVGVPDRRTAGMAADSSGKGSVMTLLRNGGPRTTSRGICRSS